MMKDGLILNGWVGSARDCFNQNCLFYAMGDWAYTGNQTPKEGENWGVVPIPQYDDNQQKITTSDMTAFMWVKGSTRSEAVKCWFECVRASKTDPKYKSKRGTKEMIQIAVLGYGTVGSGVVEVINTNHDSINKRAENEINIKYVLDLRDFPGDPVEKVLVHDYEVIANDPEVDIVVEVMGGVEPAYTFTKRALEAGKSVCTSNKELVARHGTELLAIAKEHGANYLFEASCGGGIPT